MPAGERDSRRQLHFEAMERLFKDLTAIEHLKGVFLLAADGSMLFEHLPGIAGAELGSQPWLQKLAAMTQPAAIELVYENDRIYLRQIDSCKLVVWAAAFASMALIRVTCDVLAPELAKDLGKRGRRRLFRRP